MSLKINENETTQTFVSRLLLLYSLKLKGGDYSAEVLILLSIETRLLRDPRYDIRCEVDLDFDRLNDI